MSSSVIEQIRDELVGGAERYELRRRRVRAAVVAAALVAVLAAGAVAWSAGDGGGPKVLVQPQPTTAGPSQPTVLGPLPGLERVPSPPGGAELPVPPIWTGRELLSVGAYAGGDKEGTLAAFSFDLGKRVWRKVALPPVAIGSGGTTAWTGKELVVCCGAVPTNSAAAAAYDPASDSWRVLPDAPVHGYVTSVWTGSRVVVAAPDGVASFDPASNRWTELPAPPELASFNKVVRTGRDVAVWPSPATRTVHGGNTFDFDTGKWSALPAPPQQSWPAIPDVVSGDGTLFLLGGLPAPGVGSERFVAARYDLTTDKWAALPDPLPEPRACECNLGSHVSLWTGRDLLVFVAALASGASTHGVLMAYDPMRDAWRTVGTTSTTALRPIAMARDRVFLERDGNFYVSEPGWRPGG
ncbi:MAG: hypothetical protein QOG50_3181 [Actinomycetota bacterium]|nr:hypothetical protein [Actinomycetota bacterium]